ncbi:LuxR C-terminal-related transcriptional regulator [Pantoea sp. 1.19]|uniref:helix-turn-helix transcriptional regulator n=1 Tax=Pantoea sp. 1.19 TaxID=1925589 RepID=UPI000948F33D|nr:LuxR C-terminal-related transcriptional regulator [Pantoea sp. 1.19]
MAGKCYIRIVDTDAYFVIGLKSLIQSIFPTTLFHSLGLTRVKRDADCLFFMPGKSPAAGSDGGKARDIVVALREPLGQTGGELYPRFRGRDIFYLSRSDDLFVFSAALKSLIGPDTDEIIFLEPDGPLNSRERELMYLLGINSCGKRAARAMGISEKTVSSYKRNAMRKLNFMTNVELYKYILEHYTVV